MGDFLLFAIFLCVIFSVLRMRDIILIINWKKKLYSTVGYIFVNFFFYIFEMLIITDRYRFMGVAVENLGVGR